MLLRAAAVWCGLLAAAVANGAARDRWMTPKLGERAAHQLSTVSLCAAIVLLSWLTIGWLGPPDRPGAVLIGVFWVLLTAAFEFLAGHYLFANPWSKLLADYNLLRGRIWVLVLATTALAPLWAASMRGLVP